MLEIKAVAAAGVPSGATWKLANSRKNRDASKLHETTSAYLAWLKCHPGMERNLPGKDSAPEIMLHIKEAAHVTVPAGT